MKVTSDRKNEQGFYLLELGLAIFTISLLAIISISSYLPLKDISLATAAMENSRPYRHGIMIFYQVNGRWPDDENITYLTGDANTPLQSQSESGALTITVHDFPMEQNQISLRPAVSHTDGRGTILWLCGNKTPLRNMTILGENKTTAWSSSLPSICR